ncbi:hypothetical protein [Pseudomonas citronellolis]|uniref:hypothetical protein n=1 Tax=Pseudomonas citronellolis TaxID=53408 RepID=UPI0023E37B87|nr:hypothetical protein [Pseudomonas citronellolis]MDF3934190.1 hypothetical protein [Pseudomonas citronellolis]
MFARLLGRCFAARHPADLDEWIDDLAAERRWRASPAAQARYYALPGSLPRQPRRR